MKTENSKKISRRTFIGTSALAIGGLTIVPARAVSGLGYVAPSDKLNVAGIGIGGMGRNDIEDVAKTENIVALCDVDWNPTVESVFNLYPNAKRYKDYRVMLDKQKDIDAVIVATPDHTHAIISMEAIRRGKHVYTEKPLTHTVYEARMLTEAARKHKVATQMGNQGQAGDGPRRLKEMIDDGAIGTIQEVHVWTDRPNRGLSYTYWPQGVKRPEDTPPVPETLDWDLFTGPAPMRSYHPPITPSSGAAGSISAQVPWAISVAIRSIPYSGY